MLPDTLLDLSAEEAMSYATILAAVATCDGKFTPEEMSAYEARTSSLLYQPFVKERLNAMLNERVNIEEHLAQFSSDGMKLLLRDVVMMSACDGEYRPEELLMIERIAAAADVDEAMLNQLYLWVSEGWTWHQRAHHILGISPQVPIPQ